MEKKLTSLISKSNERAIWFAGLGFHLIAGSNAWSEANLPEHRSELIVDVHTVLEHVNFELEGTDTIAIMERLYKIIVPAIAAGIAMTSFDGKTPKFFSNSQGHKVLALGASYFDTIVSHAEWADVATTFKMQETLAQFKQLHGSYIDQGVEIGSKVHTLAHAALTESCKWIVSFIHFIDEYYRELFKAKFGPAKAWHVTSQQDWPRKF
jgi:hypothetical protein